MRRMAFALCGAILLLVATPAGAEPARFQGLGFLGPNTNGDLLSTGEAISHDGAVVSLWAFDPSNEAYRWTEETGMVGLGPRWASGVSPD